MDDFERRLLSITQTGVYLTAYVKNTPDVLNMEPFVYNGQALSVAPGASAQIIIPIQADSDFAMTYMSGAIWDQASTTGILGPALVQFTDTGSGKTFFNQPTQFSMVLGNGGYPFLLPTPRVVAPNTNIKVDVTNQHATDTCDFYVSLAGARIYYRGASNAGS